MIAGHAYYFLSEVYPRMTNRRLLKTPAFLKALFADEPVVVARPENVRFAAAPFDEIHQDWSWDHYTSKRDNEFRLVRYKMVCKGKKIIAQSLLTLTR